MGNGDHDIEDGYMTATFRDHVVETLTRIETIQDGVLTQLTRMNGTQALLVTRMTAAEHAIDMHKIECPMREKVEGLQGLIDDHLIEKRTQININQHWLAWTKPIIYIIAGAISMVLLSHLDTWASLAKK